MNDIDELRNLSNTTSKDIDILKLDKVYKEILLPRFRDYASEYKDNKIRLTDNLQSMDSENMMKELFDGKFTIQRLIETEMKPYLMKKGYNVHIWSPSYSVEVSW